MNCGQPLVQILQRLRKSFPEPLAAFIVEQARLRTESIAKFPESESKRLLLTRKTLEQATSRAVADCKFSIVPEGATVGDLCCGIGGDLMAIARSHLAIGVELDPTVARMAAHNLLATGRSNAALVQSDFSRFDCTRFDFLHVDPDRRPQGVRTTSLESMNPGFGEILEKLAGKFAAIKLAPATGLDDSRHPAMHRQWIGFRRECREQVVWLNSPKPVPFPRTATVVLDSGQQESISGNAGPPAVECMAPRPGDWILEPHAAVFAAGLAACLAERAGGAWISPDSPYVLSHHEWDTRLAQRFRILATDRLDRKRLQAALREQQAGPLEWKQRAVSQQVFDAFRKLRGPGDLPTTVILYRHRSQLGFVICRRAGIA